MADKAGHLGKWWCACGHSEPRPRLAPEEAATLDWLEANDAHPDCGCPTEEAEPLRRPEHPRRHRQEAPRQHAPECLARRGRLGAAREAARRAADELKARLGPDSRRECPECGGTMVPMRAGEGFRN